MRRQRGFQVAELLVALVLGLLLIAAFLSALRQCRALFASQESVASLQDAARHALSVLVPDLEHAGFHGFTSPATARIVGALPAGAQDCWPDIGDLRRVVRGSNNSFTVGATATSCAPTASAAGVRIGADSLSVRHASL